MTPEGRVKKEHRDWFDRQGFYHFWPVQTGLGARTVDCLACVEGYFVAIEIKRPGIIEPTKLQGLTLQRVGKAGGFAFTSDSLARTKHILADYLLNFEEK